MDNWRQEIVDLIQQQGMIAAIKHYREQTGVGLAEAKTFVEELERTLAGRSTADTDWRSSTPTGSVEPDAHVLARIEQLVRDRQKVVAIRDYCRHYGVGLGEGKAAIDGMEQELGLATPRQSGCMGVVLLTSLLLLTTSAAAAIVSGR